MSVYKYRSGGQSLQRDLESLAKNSFFAPTPSNLNDPCETLVFTDQFDSESGMLSKIFGSKGTKGIKGVKSALDNLVNRKNELGIYSLSKTYNDELLWAHYAGNHYGFCIEYDLDILVGENSFHNLYCFDVNYVNSPPQIKLSDIDTKNNGIIRKMGGTKSKKWAYEKEIRIITNKSGAHHYYYSALKAIYFGVRMPDNDKNKIMNALSGREITYYQMKLVNKSYRFERKAVLDRYPEARSYLNIFEAINCQVKYSLDKIEYMKHHMKGHILITLGSKIHFSDLELLAEEVKMKLMYDAKNLFVFYYLKHDVNKNHIWALSHFRELKTDIQISGLTIDEEHFLLKKMESDNRLVIGHWLDDINLNALITIFEEENETVFIETLFKDGSSMIQEQIVTKLNQGTKYIDIDYVHNEYILVDDNGVMFFYSETGIFNQLGKM